MSGRGLHLALTDAELNQLRAIHAEDQAEYVGNVLEAEKFGSPDACETDKSWAYMHAAFTETDPDGPLSIPRTGVGIDRPSFFARILRGTKLRSDISIGDEAFAIMGETPILESEDYFIGWVPVDRVEAVADALEAVSNDMFGARVADNHLRFQAGGDSNEAAEYTKGWYPGLVTFYRRAAESGKHIIFTVDF